MKQLFSVVVFTLLLAIVAFAQLPQCTVTGTIYLPTGNIAKFAQLKIVKSYKNGQLIALTPVTITANASGVISFGVPRGSITWISGNVLGFAQCGSAGCPVSIPDASSSSLETLLPSPQTLPNSYPVAVSGKVAVNLNSVVVTPAADTLNFSSRFSATQSPSGTINIDISAASAVLSIFGRTGVVLAAANDYNWAQIDRTTSSLADITTRSAADLTSGTLPDARFPATLPALSGINLTALNASNLTSGTVPLPRLSGITNTEISNSAAIAYSKLNLTGAILNADVSAGAGLAYSKLNLTGAIINADVSASAALAYSKLNLTGAILNADLAGSITASKLVKTDITQLGTITSGGLGTGAVIGGVTTTLGSDALGDLYYRNIGGVLTRLPIGSVGQVLTVTSGVPSWVAASLLAGATPGGLSGQFQFNSSGVFGGAAGLTYAAAASPNVTVIAQNATHVPLVVRGAAGHAVSLFEVQNSAQSILVRIVPDGTLTVRRQLTGQDGTISLITGPSPLVSIIGDSPNGYTPGIEFTPLGNVAVGGVIQGSSVGGMVFTARGGPSLFRPSSVSASAFAILGSTAGPMTVPLVLLKNSGDNSFLTVSDAGGIVSTGNDGWKLEGLAVPSLNSPTVAVGGAFAAGTYFWVVTQYNDKKETVVSNQVTATPAAGDKVTLVWTNTSILGVLGYKIYRSTTSNTYGATSLVATTTFGQVTYVDTGTATITGTPPAAITGDQFVVKRWKGQTSNIINFLDETGASKFAVDSNFNLKFSGILSDSATAPTVTGFGASPSVVASNGTIAFTINVGTGGTATTGTITLPAATTGWHCQLDDISTPDSFVTSQTGGTTTTATVRNYSRVTGTAIAWTASDVLACSCRAY